MAEKLSNKTFRSPDQGFIDHGAEPTTLDHMVLFFDIKRDIFSREMS